MTPAFPRAVHALLADLRPLLGPRGVIEDQDLIRPWLTDWRGRWTGTSAAILAPANVQDARMIVARAARHGVPLVPQGGNTSMVGGATPPADGQALILSTRRLNRIRALGQDRAVTEAGVVLETLHQAAAGIGARFPLNLGARGSATIGGLVSTNAGGTQVLRFGTMRALTLGLEAILPDGTLHQGLTPLVKDSRGPAPDQWLIGAEGTMGLITAATVRLVPAVADRATAWVGVTSPKAALCLLRRLEGEIGAAIESFELMPHPMVARVCDHQGAVAPLAEPAPWQCLIECVVPDAGTRLIDALAPLMTEGLILAASLASNESQAQAWWALREGLSASEKRHGPYLAHDISVPVDAMPAFLIEAASQIEQDFAGHVASGFGHLGDGNIHFHIRAPIHLPPDRVSTWMLGPGAAATRRLHDLVTAAGGSISAEHGIGQMKRAEFARTAPRARVNSLKALKQALDPHGLFNPGKLVPLASDDATP